MSKITENLVGNKAVAKHSPGPWVWRFSPGDTGGFGHSGYDLEREAGTWESCPSHCTWQDGDPHSRGTKNTPNAHEHFHCETILSSYGYDADSVIIENPFDRSLIAAAPDLLEAAEALLGLIERMPNASAILSPGTKGAVFAEQARAAIASAQAE